MAKIGCVFWKDKIGGEIERRGMEAFPYGFTVGPHGEWEMVIAEEDKEVRKNELVNIKIGEIELPPKAIVLPCFIMRQALGVVPSLGGVGKATGVGERRARTEVIFHTFADVKVGNGQFQRFVTEF